MAKEVLLWYGLPLHASYLVEMNLCDQVSNQFPCQTIEGWSLIREVAASTRVGRLFEGVDS